MSLAEVENNATLHDTSANAIDIVTKISPVNEAPNDKKTQTQTQELLMTVGILIVLILIGIPIEMNFDTNLFASKLYFIIGQILAMLVIPLSTYSNNFKLFVLYILCIIIIVVCMMYNTIYSILIHWIIIGIYGFILFLQHVFITNQNSMIFVSTKNKSWYIALVNNTCLFIWSIFQYLYDFDEESSFSLKQIITMYGLLHIVLSLIGLSITFNITYKLKYLYSKIKCPQRLILFSDSNIKKLEEGYCKSWIICISILFFISIPNLFAINPLFNSLSSLSIPVFIYHKPILIGEERVSILDKQKKVIPVFDATINIDGVGKIFYRYAQVRGRGYHIQPDVLLLHGEEYASETWNGLGTIQTFAYWGYKTVAIDLPGYKLSKNARPPTKNHGDPGYIEFMEQIIKELRLSNVVIVALSMSGIYGLPILLENNSVDLRGFVAITPNSTNKYRIQQYKSVHVPVLVMYGENDKTKLKDESIKYMDNIPALTKVMIEKAPHAAFAYYPKRFHTEILRFLSIQCQLDGDKNYAEPIQVNIKKVIDEDTGCFVKGAYNGFFMANCATDNCENHGILDIAIDKCLKDVSCTGVVQIVSGQSIYQLRSDKKLRKSPRGEVTWTKVCENKTLITIN